MAFVAQAVWAPYAVRLRVTFSYHEDFFAKSQMGGCTFASLGLNTAAPQGTQPDHLVGVVLAAY
ncbi:hypothetical protein TH25_13545 [Thalassospira profundimaris]|uniref:Uncharacterized protein n=1 Tax=Thalassospira profundimaris TaxID=502049 RepID=A0A367X572_9PROT|nr:hypothetical protein TH25_13545 [Thalassospira profundimaris]